MAIIKVHIQEDDRALDYHGVCTYVITGTQGDADDPEIMHLILALDRGRGTHHQRWRIEPIAKEIVRDEIKALLTEKERHGTGK